MPALAQARAESILFILSTVLAIKQDPFGMTFPFAFANVNHYPGNSANPDTKRVDEGWLSKMQHLR
jgi:hypothetical protein